MIRISSLLLLTVCGFAQINETPELLVKEYEKIDLDAMAMGKRQSVEFDEKCRKRMEVEFKLARLGTKAVPDLKKSLKSTSRHVRALAAKLLGIAGDVTLSKDLEDVAVNDEDTTVRIYAIQSLGWLKAGAGTLAALAKDKNRDIAFMARTAQQQAKKDCVSIIKAEYKEGLSDKQMASAKEGTAAPL